MAAIKIDNNKCCLECGKNCNIHTLLVGKKNDVAILKKFGSFLKVKYIDPKQWKSYAHLKTCTQMFIAALFTMTKI